MSDSVPEAAFRARIEESLGLTRELLEAPYVDFAVSLAELLADTLRSRRKVIFCGNGGSAADSIHLAAEFVGRYRIDRDPLPAMALSDNASTITSVANDYDYSRVFERQVRALGAPGDVLVALSTSGASANVLKAVEAATELGLVTVGITGRGGGELGQKAERALQVPSDDTARIQEAYMLTLHVVGELVETRLFGDPWIAAFLDRDGTINVKAPEGDYITSPKALELLPGAAEAIRRLNQAGVPVVVVTNQRGVALGRMTEQDVAEVHRRLDQLLERRGAHVDAYYVCPHQAGECDCRKPEPGLIRRAAAELGLSPLSASVVIGDSQHDVEAGRRVGAATVLISPRGPQSLEAAVDRVLSG